MKSFQAGMRLTLTGWTSPPRIRRSDASPDAETMSYWLPPPWRMSVTISFDEPPYLALTWQPLAFSNGLTHCGWVYPSHAMTFSLPSPGPIFCGKFDAAVLPPPLLLDDLLSDEPQPAATVAAMVTRANAVLAPIYFLLWVRSNVWSGRHCNRTRLPLCLRASCEEVSRF